MHAFLNFKSRTTVSMQLVLLVIHMMIAAALVGVVLMQKSEGGALGIGGGGGGGFLTGRGTANLLTRTTAFLAAAFYATSVGLTLLAHQTTPAGSVLDRPAATAPVTPGAPVTGGKPADGAPATDSKSEGRGGILDKLNPQPAPLPR
jgi:preprotein translocase subunit SecG